MNQGHTKMNQGTTKLNQGPTGMNQGPTKMNQEPSGWWLSYIEQAEVRLSRWGEIVEQCWLELPSQFPVQLDAHVIMPDHVHAVIILQPQSPREGNPSGALIHQGQIHQGQIHPSPRDPGPRNPGPKPPSSPAPIPFQPMMADARMLLGKVVRAWKARSTRMIRSAGQPDFAWQSRYYDHVVRDAGALHRIRRYIAANPSRWQH